MFDIKEYKKQHYIDNIEKYKKQSEEWNRKNPKYAKEYHKNNREKRLIQMEYWRKNNSKYTKKYSREYRENNVVKIKKAQRNWLKNNPEYYNQYLIYNRGKINEKNREWSKNKRKIDPKFRLNCNVAYMIWKGLRGNKLGKKWSSILPHTIEGLMKHLEKRFTLEMNWDNYGNYWEVDHIIPKSIFKYTNPEDNNFQKCWAFKNLRPLKISENRKKSNKIIE